MEFFRTINISTDEQKIKNTLVFEGLELMSSELFLLEALNDSQAKIGSLWGEFTLGRQDIKGGLRFSLLECPNALTWTITTGYEPAPDAMIIHLTINRIEKNQEFLEEINEFLDDQSLLLKKAF
jgi:hypothetical protein